MNPFRLISEVGTGCFQVVTPKTSLFIMVNADDPTSQFVLHVISTTNSILLCAEVKHNLSAIRCIFDVGLKSISPTGRTMGVCVCVGVRGYLAPALLCI